MPATTLVHFTLAELDLDTFPSADSTIRVSGGGTSGLPESFNRKVVVHSTFKQNQDSEEGIFGMIRWDYFENQLERELCLARGHFQKPKREVKWKSQLSPQSNRAQDGSISAVLYIASPRVSNEQMNATNKQYKESQRTHKIDGEPEVLIWEKFQSSRSDWAPIDYAADFERESMNSSTNAVRKSRSDVSLRLEKEAFT